MGVTIATIVTVTVKALDTSTAGLRLQSQKRLLIGKK